MFVEQPQLYSIVLLLSTHLDFLVPVLLSGEDVQDDRLLVVLGRPEEGGRREREAAIVQGQFEINLYFGLIGNPELNSNLANW